MLYVAIDQHAKQITVAIRSDQGEDVLKRQVNTRPEKINEFFDQVVAMDTEFMAILESCGFIPPNRFRLRSADHRCVCDNRWPKELLLHDRG